MEMSPDLRRTALATLAALVGPVPPGPGVPAAGAFAETDPQLLGLLSAAGARRKRIANPGDILVSVGESDDSLIILDQGEVEVVRDIFPGQKPFLRTLSGPTYFGEACALALRTSRTATVRARTVCHVRVLLGHIVRGLLRCFPEDQQRFLQEARARLAALAVWEGVARKRNSSPDPSVQQTRASGSHEIAGGSTTSWSQGSSLNLSRRPSIEQNSASEQAEANEEVASFSQRTRATMDHDMCGRSDDVEATVRTPRGSSVAASSAAAVTPRVSIGRAAVSASHSESIAEAGCSPGADRSVEIGSVSVAASAAAAAASSPAREGYRGGTKRFISGARDPPTLASRSPSTAGSDVANLHDVDSRIEPPRSLYSPSASSRSAPHSPYVHQQPVSVVAAAAAAASLASQCGIHGDYDIDPDAPSWLPLRRAVAAAAAAAAGATATAATAPKAQHAAVAPPFGPCGTGPARMGSAASAPHFSHLHHGAPPQAAQSAEHTSRTSVVSASAVAGGVGRCVPPGTITWPGWAVEVEQRQAMVHAPAQPATSSKGSPSKPPSPKCSPGGFLGAPHHSNAGPNASSSPRTPSPVRGTHGTSSPSSSPRPAGMALASAAAAAAAASVAGAAMPPYTMGYSATMSSQPTVVGPPASETGPAHVFAASPSLAATAQAAAAASPIVSAVPLQTPSPPQVAAAAAPSKHQRCMGPSSKGRAQPSQARLGRGRTNSIGVSGGNARVADRCHMPPSRSSFGNVSTSQHRALATSRDDLASARRGSPPVTMGSRWHSARQHASGSRMSAGGSGSPVSALLLEEECGSGVGAVGGGGCAGGPGTPAGSPRFSPRSRYRSVRPADATSSSPTASPPNSAQLVPPSPAGGSRALHHMSSGRSVGFTSRGRAAAGAVPRLGARTEDAMPNSPCTPCRDLCTMVVLSPSATPATTPAMSCRVVRASEEGRMLCHMASPPDTPASVFRSPLGAKEEDGVARPRWQVPSMVAISPNA